MAPKPKSWFVRQKVLGANIHETQTEGLLERNIATSFCLPPPCQFYSFLDSNHLVPMRFVEHGSVCVCVCVRHCQTIVIANGPGVSWCSTVDGHVTGIDNAAGYMGAYYEMVYSLLEWSCIPFQGMRCIISICILKLLRASFVDKGFSTFLGARKEPSLWMCNEIEQQPTYES